MARTGWEANKEEREKADQVLSLLMGLTVDSAETVLNCVQQQLNSAKDRLVLVDEQKNFGFEKKQFFLFL